MNAAVKSRIADIRNVLGSNAVSGLLSDLRSAIKRKSGDKITVVAVSHVARFSIGQGGKLCLTNNARKETADIRFGNGQVEFDLRSPGLVLKRRTSEEAIFGLPGARNGRVVIGLEADPL